MSTTDTVIKFSVVHNPNVLSEHISIYTFIDMNINLILCDTSLDWTKNDRDLSTALEK